MKKKTFFVTIIITIMVMTACGKTNMSEDEIKQPDTKEIVAIEPEEKPVVEEEIPDSNSEEEVVFLDEYLGEEASRKASSLTVDGLKEVTDLDLKYDKITIPEELAYFSNLKHLRMISDKNGDISWLSNVPNLEYLELRYNHIDNIEEICNCTNLIALDIESYNITDISSLEKLESLEELEIESDALQDFSPIDSLVNLRILKLYSNTIEKLNINFSSLANLHYVDIQGGSINDLTTLDSLNVYNEPTFSNGLYCEEDYNGLGINNYYSTESYRDNYSDDKRPEDECFRKINIIAEQLTDESIQTIANINYKYLQSLDFHIDKNYELIYFRCYTEDGFIDEIPEKYSEMWNNLILANGDPLLQNEAVTVTPLLELEDFNNPKVYFDGRYVGLYCSLEDMVNGFTIDGDNAIDYLNTIYVRAGGQDAFSLDSEYGLTISVENTDENIAKPISECEVTEIMIRHDDRDADLELRLPQGNEVNEYVSWNYPYRNFRDIYENCNFKDYGGDSAKCDILCNENGDMIEIFIDDDEIAFIKLSRK